MVAAERPPERRQAPREEEPDSPSGPRFAALLSLGKRLLVLLSVGAMALADRPVVELSDGERQKLMIARALAQETPLILLDEPTAHLDAMNRLGPKPWPLSFSYGRAMQSAALKLWSADLTGKVAEARSTAFEAYKSVGLPHRRLEDWKYTDLRALMRDLPERADTPTHDQIAAAERLSPSLPVAEATISPGTSSPRRTGSTS